MLVRALTTLIGLAGAAALLLLVPETGTAEGGGLWKRAALLAAAGFVAGFFYQLGGIRRPGVRVNVPVLVAGVLPWTLLAIAICAQRAGTPAFLTDLVRESPRQRARRRRRRRSRGAQLPAVGLARVGKPERVRRRSARRDRRRSRGRARRRAARPRRPAGRLVPRSDALAGSGSVCGCLRVLRQHLFGHGKHAPARAPRRPPQVAEGRCAVDAVAPHQQPDRPLDRDAAVEG